MKSPKKKKPKTGAEKKEGGNDPIDETRKRLEQQIKALQKIIGQFSKKENDK